MGVSKRIRTRQITGTTRDVAGLDQLLRNLNTCQDRVGKKALRAGINAGMSPIMKSMRRAIGMIPTPSGGGGRRQANLAKEAKKSIGKKLKKRRGEYEGRVGFAVGKKMPKNLPDRPGRPGVGISARNIHWFVLGTDIRQHKSGKQVGEIKPLYEDVTDMAVAMSRNEILNAWRKKYKQTLEREVNKLPK